MRVAADRLVKVYPDGTRALNEVSFEITPGEGVVILGANGCGKSTLLKCLLGLEPISGGDVQLGAQSLRDVSGRDLRALRQRMGSVFQQFNLVSNLSAFQNVLFGRLGRDGLLRSLAPLAKAELRDQAMACLHRVGLIDKAASRVDQLSGGQQQRVAIARMLMQAPEIVFADEPVASLDPKAGQQVMELLWEVVDERGITVICVLHQLDLARAFAGRIIGMKAGEVVMDAAPSAIAARDFQALYERDADQGVAAESEELADYGAARAT